MKWLVLSVFLCLLPNTLLAQAPTVSNKPQAGSSLSLCNLCEGYTISKRADGAVVIRCPGRAEPVFVLQNCVNPSVKRVGTQATVTCYTK